MKKINFKQPLGEVSGDTEGRRYHQDGLYFDNDGNEWVDPNAPVKKQTATKGTTKSTKEADPAGGAAAGGEDDQVGTQLGAE